MNTWAKDFEQIPGKNSWKHSRDALCKKCPYSELFWFAFSCIWTEYGPVFIPNVGKKGPE